MLLRAADPRVVDDVDWDFIRFKFKDGQWFTCRSLALSDPLGFNKALTEGVFDEFRELDELVDALDVRRFQSETFQVPHLKSVDMNKPKTGDYNDETS